MPTLDLISSIATAAMSIIISAVALIFNFRQNVGWPPITVVAQSAMSGFGVRHRHTFQVCLEVWNRRTYPVALRHADAKISGVALLHGRSDDADDDTYVIKNIAHKRLEIVVKPKESACFQLSVTFENQSLDAMRPQFEISILYFDPHANENRTLKLTHKHFYPELGWEKSEEQRSRIGEVYEDLLKNENTAPEAEADSLRADPNLSATIE